MSDYELAANAAPLQFSGSDLYTLGVELELQTIDRHSCELIPAAPLLLQNVPPILRSRLSPEFIQSILEVQTGICFTVDDVENDLLATLAITEELAWANGCRLFSASLHPFAFYRQQLLTTDARYTRIMEELQLVGRRFIAQGLHVHVGVASGDQAMKVCRRIQTYLPLLLALSVSSPFFQGEDTGFMSYRIKLFEALPRAGFAPHFTGWAEYASEIEKLRSSGLVESFRDLWWDVRPNGVFGTVEVRICDLPYRFIDILVLTAVIQGLVATLVESGEEFENSFNLVVLQSNKWQAARHGLAGGFIDPSGWLGQGIMPIREAVRQLVQRLEPMAIRLGTARHLGHVESIIATGTGADFLRRRFTKSQDFLPVIDSLQSEFWHGSL